MKQLMVISHDTYASGLTPTTDDIDSIASLAVGAFAVIDKDPDAVSTYNHVCDLAAASESQTPKFFQIVTMTANGLKWSPIIEKARCEMLYQATVAAVAKTMNISVTLSNIEVGQVAGFIVTDLTKPAHVLTRNRTYEYTVVTGDTEATIIAALIAKVNADTLKIVTASAGTDIVLTADTAGNPFQISMTGIFRGATITSAQAVVVGTGLGTQLRAYEKECEVEQGATNYPTEGSLFFTKASEVVTTSAYNLYYLTFDCPTQRPLIPGTNPKQQLLIATLSTLTASGNADKSVEALYNMEIDFNG